MGAARSYRTLLFAAGLSAAVHAALVTTVPSPFETAEETVDAPSYVAVLVPPPPEPGAAKVPAAQPIVHRARPHARPRLVVPRPMQPVMIAAAEPVLLPPPMQPLADAAPLPALDPVTPLPEPVPELDALAREHFDMGALPDNVQIDYALTSSVADAHAVYRWQREGDHYRITGEGAADGFFSLFLDGRMLQESEGTVTRDGLKPARFLEKKPNTEDEGLEFDWAAHQVTYEWGDNHRKTAQLADNSVDWLSMIFQLAHVPPPEGVHEVKLSVLTQRKQYHFDLQVLGLEYIVIPLGHVRALHLRHVDRENPKEVVDVWLGVDQHYLPVKLRYPVARNRFMVEQIATRLSER